MKEPKFKIGDDVFLFEEKDKNKNGIRAKIERSKVRELSMGGSGGVVGFEYYVLANGTTTKGENLYFLEEFQEKITQFYATDL